MLIYCSALARNWSQNVFFDRRKFSVVAAANKVTTKNVPTKEKEILKIGTTYHGFNCVESKFYPEFNMTAYLLDHEKLHTKFLHVNRNDINNLFSINFRTPIYDSTGYCYL